MSERTLSERTADGRKRVALLTGAAGGIGAATAEVFADRGYDLVLLDNNAENLQSLAKRLANKTGVLALDGDLADFAWSEEAVKTAAQTFGILDVLVNLAAWREITTMNAISLDSWQRTLDVSLTSPAFLSRWCAARMPRGGAIINISSLNAHQSAGNAPAYVAAKGGLESLSHELAALYGPRGIRVVAVALGAIDTALSHDVLAGADKPEGGADDLTGDTLRDFAEDMIPLRRFGTADEAARAIAWLASEDASYLTGTTIELDGGWGHHHLPHKWKKAQLPEEFA
jgi:3-oxoacyl-[acyl-carrier protein] reductase